MNAPLPELPIDNEHVYYRAKQTSNGPAVLAPATESDTSFGLSTTVETYNRMLEQDFRRRGRGRPLAILEEGAKEKIELWLQLEGKHRSYLTKDGKAAWTRGPTQKTLGRWLLDGVPRDKLQDFADRTGIPVKYFRSSISVHEFERYKRESDDRNRIVRDPRDKEGFISALRRAMTSNDNCTSSLRAIVNSEASLTTDDIADILNVSFIQVREILQDLMKIGVVTPKVDHGETIIVLSEIATGLLTEIGELLNGA
jgi:hypothetical protein